MSIFNKGMNMRVKAKISFNIDILDPRRAKILVEVAMNYALLKLAENNQLSPDATITAIDLRK